MALGDPWSLPIPIAEKILRSVVVYFALIVLLRVFGKRELAQLNPFDFVVLLTLSNTVQNAIIGADNSLSGGLIGALTLLVVNYLCVRFVFRHQRLDRIFGGRQAVLIHKGRVQEKALARELLNRRELLIAAHRQGFQGLDEVEECVLQPGGFLSFRGSAGKAGDPRWQDLFGRLDKIQSRLAAIEKRSG